ncbi:hypothetical protein C4D60_Mb04t16550 [Musa balbisiana]|uniref:Uncharacterized protein n=1 Tax=Musa balbisiana TaxID=52838 RepID=A0A4S8KCI3_MUSBA|nr:hypothetical protein C4D60_Mb04t16550 [Musa balbisiana]
MTRSGRGTAAAAICAALGGGQQDGFERSEPGEAVAERHRAGLPSPGAALLQPRRVPALQQVPHRGADPPVRRRMRESFLRTATGAAKASYYAGIAPCGGNVVNYEGQEEERGRV